MRWPLTSRAARFAARLDARPVTGSLDDDTAALVQLAERLRRVEPPVMSPAYAAELRTRLLTAAPELLDSASPAEERAARLAATPRHGTPKLRLAIAGATSIVVATGVGLGFASQSALPGDPLYPFKQGLEQVQVATARSLLDKGNEQLSQASTRLSEVHDLATQPSSGPGTSVLMTGALGDFRTQAYDGTRTLLQAYRDDHVKQAIADLREFTGTSVDALSTLQTQVPPALFDDVGYAASQMRTDDAVAVRACTDCTGPPALVLPTALAAIVPGAAAGLPAPGTAPPPPAPAGAPTASSVSTDASVSVDPTAPVPSSIPTSVIAPPTASGTPSTPGHSSAPPTTVTVPPATVPDPSGAPTSNPTTQPPSSAPTTDPGPGPTTSPPVSTEPTPPSESTDPVQPPSSGLTSLPPSGSESAPTSLPTP
jgi:hypothetical protein